MPAVQPVSTAWHASCGCGEEHARDPARMFDCGCGTGDSYCEEYLPCPECAPCEAEESEDGGEASGAANEGWLGSDVRARALLDCTCVLCAGRTCVVTALRGELT